jgi:hypothetical protein
MVSLAGVWSLLILVVFADIDFGFLLSNSPGGMGFESAPFKLTPDYIDILGGIDSEKWTEFKNLFKVQFRIIRKHAERLITLVDLMQKGIYFSMSLSVTFFLTFSLFLLLRFTFLLMFHSVCSVTFSFFLCFTL